MGYRLARLLIKILFRLAIRLEINGQENLPPTGAYIAAGNHAGRLDAALVYHHLDRRDITMLVAEKYRRQAIFRWFVRNLDALWLDRFNADYGALREALNRLRRGGVLILGPEGTRSPHGALIEGRPGASYLAAKSGVPVVPVGITGSYDEQVVSQLRRLRRPLITINVGESFILPPLTGPERAERLRQYTDEIMCRIAALLPPSQRGFYAGHPRLLELVGMQGYSKEKAL